MISGRRESSMTLVLEREEELSPRLLELREKIHDKDYLNNAIFRIAQVISRKLVADPDELQFRD